MTDKGVEYMGQEIGRYIIGTKEINLKFSGFTIHFGFAHIFRCKEITDRGVHELAHRIFNHLPLLQKVNLNFWG